WAGIYSCWGGCLNQCVLLGDKKPEERVPCYWNCVAKCFPQQAKFSPTRIGLTKISLGSTSMTRSLPASEIPGSLVPSDPSRVVRPNTDLKTCLNVKKIRKQEMKNEKDIEEPNIV
ncbi:hypothetical protein M8C21_022785, partial [Ambrosia artemisiifolia]